MVCHQEGLVNDYWLILFINLEVNSWQEKREPLQLLTLNPLGHGSFMEFDRHNPEDNSKGQDDQQVNISRVVAFPVNAIPGQVSEIGEGGYCGHYPSPEG